MNDLISRKRLLELANKEGAYGYVDAKQILEAPTAYDPDKVVEALDNYGMWKEFMTYALTHREVKIIGKAIEIVRKGGVE